VKPGDGKLRLGWIIAMKSEEELCPFDILSLFPCFDRVVQNHHSKRIGFWNFIFEFKGSSVASGFDVVPPETWTYANSTRR